MRLGANGSLSCLYEEKAPLRGEILVVVESAFSQQPGKGKNRKMAKKKELLSKAPWRGEEDREADKFKDAKLKVTSEPGATPTMHVPRKRSKYDDSNLDDDSIEIDPQLRYSFHRNYQFLQRVFSIDTIVKPLPPAMGYNISRNLSFFTRIFTQFFDPEGIANAQKSLGLGQEEKARRVR